MNPQPKFGSTPFLIIVFILLFGGSLWYWFFVPKMFCCEPTMVPPTEAPLNTGNNTSDKKADWKTYTNDDYSFKLRYPQDWDFTLLANKELNSAMPEISSESENCAIVGTKTNNDKTLPKGWAASEESVRIGTKDYIRRTVQNEKNIIISSTVELSSNVSLFAARIAGDDIGVSSKCLESFKDVYTTFQFTNKSSASLTKNDILNSYYILEDHKCTFKNGTCYIEYLESAKGGGNQIMNYPDSSYTAYMSNVLMTDVDKDGDQDALAIISEQYGGTGSFVSIALFKDEGDDVAVYKSKISIGDRTIVNSINIQNNIINLSLTTHGPNTPMTRSFKIEDNLFVEAK